MTYKSSCCAYICDRLQNFDDCMLQVEGRGLVKRLRNVFSVHVVCLDYPVLNIMVYKYLKWIILHQKYEMK